MRVKPLDLSFKEKREVSISLPGISPPKQSTSKWGALSLSARTNSVGFGDSVSVSSGAATARPAVSEPNSPPQPASLGTTFPRSLPPLDFSHCDLIALSGLLTGQVEPRSGLVIKEKKKEDDGLKRVGSMMGAVTFATRLSALARQQSTDYFNDIDSENGDYKPNEEEKPTNRFRIIQKDGHDNEIIFFDEDEEEASAPKLPKYHANSLKLCNNKLTGCEGLGLVVSSFFVSPSNLVFLDLSNNKLSTLPEVADFELLPNLSTLFLHNNCVSDMHGTLHRLRSVKGLKSLTLHNNPLQSSSSAAIKHYRSIILSVLKKLKKLDGVVVTRGDKANCKISLPAV